MFSERLTTSKLRKEVDKRLRYPDFTNRLAEWRGFPARKIVNPLIGHLYHAKPLLKWRAVSAIGEVVAALAEQDMESSRVIMRRFIWMLNDESGGIGWGIPESMGEVMARQPRLADEYDRVLLSYVCEDGNYLENSILQQGVLWGLGRLAQAGRALPSYALDCILPFLSEEDPQLKGMAGWVLAMGGHKLDSREWAFLEQDPGSVVIYSDGELQEIRISRIGRALLSR